jgi:hypothetical protein
LSAFGFQSAGMSTVYAGDSGGTESVVAKRGAVAALRVNATINLEIFCDFILGKRDRFAARAQERSGLIIRHPSGLTAISEQMPKAQAEKGPETIHCHIPRRRRAGGDE